jgi:hypothetical protein
MLKGRGRGRGEMLDFEFWMRKRRVRGYLLRVIGGEGVGVKAVNLKC